jgi:hypothetical protein
VRQAVQEWCQTLQVAQPKKMETQLSVPLQAATAERLVARR